MTERPADGTERKESDVVSRATKIGGCAECGSQFEFGTDDNDVTPFDPCPECGSLGWSHWGYRLPEGLEVPIRDVN